MPSIFRTFVIIMLGAAVCMLLVIALLASTFLGLVLANNPFWDAILASALIAVVVSLFAVGITELLNYFNQKDQEKSQKLLFGELQRALRPTYKYETVKRGDLGQKLDSGYEFIFMFPDGECLVRTTKSEPYTSN